MKTKQNKSDELNAIFQNAFLTESNKTGTGAGRGDGWRGRLQGAAVVVNPDAAADKLAAARAGLPGAAIGALLLDVGKQAARIQARRLVNLRGVSPSQTSIDDAAADATAGAVRVGLRLEHFKIDLAKDYQPRARGGRMVKRSARGLCLLYANRAAFRSLCAWASVGVTGQSSELFGQGGAISTELTSQLAAQMSCERDGGGDLWQVEAVAARWRVARWLYRVGVQSFAASLPTDQRGAARAAAMAAAVQRVRTVADCLFGLPLAESIAANGYASGAAFVNSCRAADFFPTLARAATGAGDVAAARAAMRRAALAAADAIRAQRAAGDAGRAVAGFHSSNIKRAVRGVIASNNGRAVWGVAAAARADALALAVWWRGVAARRAADNAAAFKLVLQGVRGGTFGDLGEVFKTSRRSAKLHSLFIRRNPSGAVTRRATVVGESLKVGRAARRVPCVTLAGAVVPLDVAIAGLAAGYTSPAADVSPIVPAVVVTPQLDHAARRAARAADVAKRPAVVGVRVAGKSVRYKVGADWFVKL
jgi:hypothetical protein